MFKLIRAFIKKELIQALRDPKMKFLLFAPPIIQMTVFGLALENEVKNINFYARPMMSDPLFTDISRDATASGWFIPVTGNEAAQGESIDKFASGSIETALYAPEGGVTQSFERGNGRIDAVIDGSNLIRARGINNYLQTIILNSVNDRLGTPAKTPIEFSVSLLYNPEMVTAYNLVPGVLCMLMCIITIMMTSMSLAKEKEIGTFEMLISAPVTVTEILLGKTIPYILIGCVNLPLVFFVAVAGFKVPMRGSYFWLAISTLFFLITTVSIGTMISTIAKNQQQAMMGGFIFILPAILLSGIMYPIDSMPFVLKIVAAFDPLKYYSTLLRNIMLKGGDYHVVFENVGALLVISAVSVTTAFKRFRLQLG